MITLTWRCVDRLLLCACARLLDRWERQRKGAEQ